MRILISPPQLDYGDRAAVAAVLPALAIASPAPGGRYLHWDEFRHRQPIDGLSIENSWHAVKLARKAASRTIPLRDVKGDLFSFANVLVLTEYLHLVDRDAAGAIRTPTQVTDPGTRERYLLASLAEESITSSQLEGASTSRANAKQMLREGRPARDHGEQMILNNYRAMEWLRSKDSEPLTPAIVLELHALVTEGTLDDSASVGRFRTDADDIVVSDDTGRILHRPPKAAELPQRLDDLCAFANARESGDQFLHPALRSILLHFQLAYDHPFVDGNGRVARALFYWSMARHGYWLCEFVSISRILRRARGQYLRSFLYTETDGNDTTYFLVDQLRVLRRAIEDLHEYLARKAAEAREAEIILQRSWKTALVLNERQLALLARALRQPETTFTIEAHRRSHGVAYETARTDLIVLVDDGLLTMRRRGRRFLFVPSEDLRARAGLR
ncbi:MAG: Fic family protein [Gemmatimonadaceae bacterium]